MLQGYYFDRLTDAQKAAYEQLRSGVAAGRTRIVIDCPFGTEGAREVLYAVQHENPQYYYCIFQLVIYRVHGSLLEYELAYSNCDYAAYNDALENAAANISARLGGRTSEYDICLAVHDFLAETVTGDEQAADAADDVQLAEAGSPRWNAAAAQIMNGGATHSFTAYGALVDRRALCMGVACAAKVLLDRFGVQCALATGAAVQGGTRHMWNVVEVDGRRYNLDVTSDLRHANFPFTRYGCCLVPDKLYSRYFSQDRSFGCDSFKDSYFVHSGTYCRTLQDVISVLEGYDYKKRGTLALYYDGTVSDEVLNGYARKILSRRFGGLNAPLLAFSGGVFQCGVERKGAQAR